MKLSVPWNVTRHADALRRADVLIISPAKAGRTWLRVLLNKYLALHYGVPFALDDLHARNAAIPSIRYEHWLWWHFRFATPMQRWRGHYVISRSILQQKKIVFLIRDPRDLIVSAYFHEHKREQHFPRFEGSLSEFIRDRKRGIGAAVEIINTMYRKLHGHPNWLLLKYEDMRRDVSYELRRLLAFLDIGQGAAALAAAIAFADFDNLQRMERNGAFDDPILRPADAADVESYKVRKGKVGGYVDYADAADLDYLEQHLTALDAKLGYRPAGTGRPDDGRLEVLGDPR